MHAPSQEERDDSKGSVYVESWQVFGHFSKYHMKILFGDFNIKLGREDIFKREIGNEFQHQYN